MPLTVVGLWFVFAEDEDEEEGALFSQFSAFFTRFDTKTDELNRQKKREEGRQQPYG